MSDHANGDHPPPNLRNAFNVMRGEIKRLHKTANARNRAGLVRGPRQFCIVCGTIFDFAIVRRDYVAAKSVCGKCKGMLSQGYTAFITGSRYAVLKSEACKAAGMDGRIVKVTDEYFARLEKQINDGLSKQKPTEPT